METEPIQTEHKGPTIWWSQTKSLNLHQLVIEGHNGMWDGRCSCLGFHKACGDEWANPEVLCPTGGLTVMAPWMQTRPHWLLLPWSGIHRSDNSACLHYITNGRGMKSISVNVYEELERGAGLGETEQAWKRIQSWQSEQTTVLSHFGRWKLQLLVLSHKNWLA